MPEYPSTIVDESVATQTGQYAGYTLTDIQEALFQMRLRLPQYDLYADYYDGNHSIHFATDKWKSQFASLFRRLSDNLCQVVVDAPAERLQVESFGVEEGGGSGAETITQTAGQIWQQNRMDVRAGVVHREALRAGDAYVLVWPDVDGRPVFWPQLASLCTVAYDQEYQGRQLWAAKLWLDYSTRRIRLNMFYPDRIEKYESSSAYAQLTEIPQSAGVFRPYESEPVEPWPLPNPWGIVPLFHFANNAWMSVFGRSELRSIIPLQDALNKTLADQLIAQEFMAYPQRWVVGLEVELDPVTGKARPPFEPGADRLWAAANENIKFGQFNAADLKQYLEIEESLRLEIARLAALPPHFLTQWVGRPPSGEALRASESRFVKKVQDRQAEYGNIWEDAMELALRMAASANESVRLTCNWVDAASVDEADRLANIMLKKQIGISTEQALAEAGYAEQDIVRMTDEKQAAADQQRQLFNSGLIPPPQGSAP
jgi:hypothetical protein